MKNAKIVWLCLVIFCLCFIGFAVDHSRASLPAVTVIDVDDQGYFNYHGKVSKLIKRGQEVIWICNSPFTIYFGNQSPLVLNARGKPAWGKVSTALQSSPLSSEKLNEIIKNLEQMKTEKNESSKLPRKMSKMELDSTVKVLEMVQKRMSSQEYHIVQGWISNNVLSGKYKYIVAAYMNGKIWVDDPEDIVDPPRR